MNNKCQEKTNISIDEILSTLIQEKKNIKENSKIQKQQNLIKSLEDDVQEIENKIKHCEYKIDVFKNIKQYEPDYNVIYKRINFLERNLKNKMIHKLGLQSKSEEMLLGYFSIIGLYLLTNYWVCLPLIMGLMSMFLIKIMFRGSGSPVQNWIGFMVYSFMKKKESLSENYTEEELETFIKLAIYENNGIHSIPVDKFYEREYWEKRKKLLSFINTPYYYKY